MNRSRSNRPSRARALRVALRCGVLAALLLAHSSRASERLHLRWSAPSECPTAEQIERDVDNLLSNPDPSSIATVEATGAIHASARGYTLKLSANGQTRVIEAADCRQLAEAAALLLALLVDPAHVRAAGDDSTQPAQTTQAQPTPAASTGNTPRVQVPASALPSAATTPEKSERDVTGRRWFALAELGARVDVGNWPDLEPALLAGAGVEHNRLRWIAHAGVGRTAHLPVRGGGDLAVSLMRFDVAFAYKLRSGAWMLEPGISAELEATRASGGEFNPAAQSALAMSAVALGRVAREIGAGLRGWAELGAGVPVLRPRWVLADGEAVHRFGPFFGVRAGLQLVF